VDSILVYDGDCRVCTMAKSVVQTLDLRRRIRAIPLQSDEAADVLAGVDSGALRASFHFIRGGRTTSRGEGVLEIIGALPMGGGVPRLAGHVPRLVAVSERVYDLFHGVRDALTCGITGPRDRAEPSDSA